MARTVQASFDQYRSNLELTDRQEALVSIRWRAVVAALETRLSLHPERSRLSGSWDRNTITKHLSEGDVDVMVILDYSVHGGWDTADGTAACLDRFKSILSAAYPNTENRKDRNCINMRFREFRLDVVPTFRYADGHYSIPDSIRRLWVPTDPIRFQVGVTAINRQMGGGFVPLIKMMKGWNRHSDWRIRSFHLECMMYHHFLRYTGELPFPVLVVEAFDMLVARLQAPALDPVMSGRVDTYLDNGGSPSRRRSAIDKAVAGRAIAAVALSHARRGDEGAAIDAWKSIMGRFFPAYG